MLSVDRFLIAISAIARSAAVLDISPASVKVPIASTFPLTIASSSAVCGLGWKGPRPASPSGSMRARGFAPTYLYGFTPPFSPIGSACVYLPTAGS